MHRNYGIAQPIQIIRYSDRIEVRNPGYSLKDPREFGVPGSRLRNPAIAAIMHELHWAETKGSGIRTMRRLSSDAGLPASEFISNRASEEFRAVFHLHHLSDEADYAWLSRFDAFELNPEDKKVLLFARLTGAVDNASCRDTCGFDTLGASLLLRKLRDKGILEKNRGGNRTYYSLPPEFLADAVSLKDANLGPKDVNLGPKDANLVQDGLPQNLKERIAALAPHASSEIIRGLILDLCSWKPLNDDALAKIIGRDARYLRIKYLSNMVRSGELRWFYPDIPNHPLQAYVNPKRENPHDK
jgi:ATP-dependent DNA helicase RecG